MYERLESVSSLDISTLGAVTFQLLVPVVAPIVKARVTDVVEAPVSTYTAKYVHSVSNNYNGICKPLRPVGIISAIIIFFI